jgi:hypothetical protein
VAAHMSREHQDIPGHQRRHCVNDVQHAAVWAQASL